VNAADERAFAVLEIAHLDLRTFSNLDDDLAQIENFATADELRLALRRFYPGLCGASEIVVVHFKLVLAL
jgi:hypothetical protein